MRKCYSLALPVIAIAILSGCGPRRDAQGPTFVAVDALSQQLGMTATHEAGMVVFTGSQGTIVFNPRVNGIYVGSGVCFRGFRPIVTDTQVSVPPNFVEQCSQMLGTGRTPVPTISTIPSTPVQMGKYHVVLDAGHGGKDPGAIAVNGAHEKDINLSITEMVAQDLMAKGIQVTMTRDSDVFIDLDDRPAVANRIGADAFVAIHADASANRATSRMTATPACAYANERASARPM